MAVSLSQALRILQTRAADDMALAETVLYLAEDAESVQDPFEQVTEPVGSAARQINERRLAGRSHRQLAGTIDTAGVVELLNSINSRKGVDRRRRRGQLIGWRNGRQILHPSWQFDQGAGDTWPGLDRVVDALSGAATSPQAADALMTAWRNDLGGRSLADLLAAGKIDTLVRLIDESKDQS